MCVNTKTINVHEFHYLQGISFLPSYIIEYTQIMYKVLKV